MQGLPESLTAMPRASQDVEEVLRIGARSAASATSSGAVILLRRGGGVRIGAIHDDDPTRLDILTGALRAVTLDGPASPFGTALGTGQNALLDLAQLAYSESRPHWADELDRRGVAYLGLTPLLAGERVLGLLATLRTTVDRPMRTDELAAQARLASQLAASLDTATVLGHMRQSSLVVDAMPDAIIGFSRDREVILWNHGAERMYGILEDEALGQRMDDLISTDYDAAGPGQGNPAMSLINQGSWTGRVRQRTRSGRVLHADVSLASIVEDGVLRGAVSINRDVSGLIEAEARRRDNERRMQALLDASRAMTAVFDRDGQILAVNQEWSRSFSLGGLGAEDVGVGADYVAALRRAASTSEDAAAVLAGIEAVLSGRASAFEWDYDTTDASGATHTYMVSVAPMPGADGGAFATHTDITTRKRMELQLAHQASHDPLTGLRTRRRVEQDLTELLARAADTPLAVGALIVNFDRFKDVNDTLGHEAGDEVLVQVAARLRAFEPARITGRLAGDEFGLIVPGVRDRAELARLAGDLERTLIAPIRLDERELPLRARIGAALSTDVGQGAGSPTALLRAADTAMHRARARGRTSIVAFDEGLRADVRRRVQVAEWLDRALAQQEFSVAYQPQFRCIDGRQVGVEALVRWHHPEAGDISPSEFVPIAEKSGAIIRIGAWVLDQACQRAAEWAPLAGPDFTVAVNLSPHQLIDPSLLPTVRSALLRSRLPARSLMLEITEGALIEDPEAAAEALARLRSLGVQISLDDFGTGYSSLAYLDKFPVDQLKIDRTFVRDIERDRRTLALAEGIVRIGHALGMLVLAEGVETPGQLRILTGAGCDCYQGFIAAPAETADRATERIRDRALGGDISRDAALAAGRTITWE